MIQERVCVFKTLQNVSFHHLKIVSDGVKNQQFFKSQLTCRQCRCPPPHRRRRESPKDIQC